MCPVTAPTAPVSTKAQTCEQLENNTQLILPYIIA
jgi:hypothetical protein